LKKLLLHTCCAPCSSAVIEWLMANGVRPTLFFYNPNIFPQKEYEIRKKEIFRYAKSLDLEIIDADYDHELWLADIRGLENEPERGARCLQCFKLRLQATAQYAHEAGFQQFATTLASSRWKDLAQIAEAGNTSASKYPNLQFLEKNWRKDGLSERRNELLTENGFYNQGYCGCEFSVRKKKKE